MVISTDSVSAAQAFARFPLLLKEILGSSEATFTRIAPPDAADANSICFLSNAKVLAQAATNQAGVLVVPMKARALAEQLSATRTVILSPNPELAMTMVAREYFLKTPYTNRSVEGIHATAVVSPNSQIATGVRIGPNAFVGEHVQIAAGCYIGANAVIEDETTIGENTVIHPLTFIGFGTQIGAHCEIHPNSVIGKEGYGYSHDEKGNHYRIPHQGRVVLEDDVHIGASSTIDRGTYGETRLKRGTKLDNQVHIAHNCEIGTNSLITAGFKIAGSSKVGNNFIAGGGTTITGHVRVCDNVNLAGNSVVTKSVEEPGQYGGHPLQTLQKYLRTYASYPALPEMRKQLAKLLKDDAN